MTSGVVEACVGVGATAASLGLAASDLSRGVPCKDSRARAGLTPSRSNRLSKSLLRAEDDED